MFNTNLIEVSKREYDVVIVGSGIAASIIAKELSISDNFNILIVEAGLGKDFTQSGYQRYLETFYSAVIKDNNSPYPRNGNADMPRSPLLKQLREHETNDKAYWVQFGPFVSDSVYSRVQGGTTMHWEGKAIRMLREDFEMHTRYGRGLDWPIGLDDLMPYYRKAEFEIGVSGDADSQSSVGVEFEEGYVYPMHEMPPSYLDTIVAKGVNGMEVQLDEENRSLALTTFPQGRNGIPNQNYRRFNNGQLFSPKGAVAFHQAEEGERCQGNTNCVPICPVQAKYDARKTLVKALRTGRVDLLSQAVASHVNFDPETGAVANIEIKVYESPDSPVYETGTVRGKIFVLAANAVENARLLLASALQSQDTPKLNPLIGKNLMDHPYLLAWGLLPQNAGVGRGPVVTSGICNLRRGEFRKNRAAFAVDIHNDGWGWATGSPGSDLEDAIDGCHLYGAELRQRLVDQISRQLLLATMVEMLPEPTNCVTVDPKYKDDIGNMRPVVSFSIPQYSLAAIEYSRWLSSQVFQRLEAQEFTRYSTKDYGYLEYNGAGYAIRGGNHLAGTHIMGTNSENSVVNSYQKSHDHPNLYLVGAGSMPTIGSSNTTLTIAALCFRTSEQIRSELKRI